MTRTSARPDLLLMLRGGAAIAVVFWHVQGYQGDFHKILNMPGRVAVWIFFGISGYVIAHGFISQRYIYVLDDLLDFWRNRLLRIYPLFLVVSAISLITALLVEGSSPISMKDLPSQIFAIQFNQNYILSGVFWTLGIEIQFYIIAPFLTWLVIASRRFWPVVGLVMYFIMWYWPQYSVAHLGSSADNRNIMGNLQHFLVGIMACSFSKNVGCNKKLMFITLAGGVALLGVANYLYHANSRLFWTGYGAALVGAAMFLIIVAHVIFERVNFGPNVPFKILAVTGTLSYGIYAWHGYLAKYIPWTSDKFFILLVSSFLLAGVSYRLVEIPASKFRRGPGGNVSYLKKDWGISDRKIC